MAFCKQCGHQLPDDSKFCNECGSPVEKKQGSDEISLNTEISIRVVLNGESNGNTEVEVYLPHLSKTVAVKVPNSISIGQSLRLRGLGHTSPDGEKGDAYIRIVQIDYDKTIPDKQESQRKVRYEGEVRVCPQCREVINAFVPVCPSCGHEMRGSKATSSVHELAVNLNKAQSVDDKERLIRNFYIPNTREDIIEFLILASSNIETNSDCVDAWAAKLEQVYQKAKLTFGDGAEFEYVETMYNKTTAKLHMKKNITNVTNASVSLLHGTGTVINTIWKCLCSMLAFVWRIVCTMCKRFGTEYSCALLLFGIGSLVALVPDLWEIADGLRAISLIVAAVTLFGRAWRALDK